MHPHSTFGSHNDDDILILDIIPLPELHLLLGGANTIFKFLSAEFEDAHSWARYCGSQQTVTYINRGFDGNACAKLLQNVDYLRRIAPIECFKYVEAFASFKKVVDGYFSKDLCSEYETYIYEFKQDLKDANISFTPRLHAIFEHIPHFCNRHQKGLGLFSEQARESSHHDSTTVWKFYKVPKENPN